jgi:hypothetical protein
MNVKYAVDLLREVLSECNAARSRLLARGANEVLDIPDLVLAQRDAGLTLLGDVIGPLLAVVMPADSRLSGCPRTISEQLVSLSKMAHALALLYNDVVPSVLVHSLLVNAFSSFSLVALVSEHAFVTNKSAPLVLLDQTARKTLYLFCGAITTPTSTFENSGREFALA